MTAAAAGDAAKKERTRAARLLKLFSLRDGDFSAMLAYQSGICAICLKPPVRPLCVDHDHKTGLVRGLLCNMCNRAIAKFRDDAVMLERASSYLRSPPATYALGGERYGLIGKVTNKAKTRRRLNKNNHRMLACRGESKP